MKLPELVLIVEGQGDVAALPVLVGKISGWIGDQVFTKNPIRVGGWGSIKKSGGLEKWVALAASRPDCRKIVIVTDLDDGCPVQEREAIEQRVTELRNLYEVEIEICFCVREFEVWLLRSLDLFSSMTKENIESGIEELIEKADRFRDAKGKLRGILKDGYSESYDQSEMAAKIDPGQLFNRDRSFKRFVKAVTGLDYETLGAA